MAFIHGKNTHLTYGTVNLSPYLNSVDFPRGAATAETTVFGVNATQFVGGLVDTTITASGLFDSAVVSALGAYIGSTAQSFIYGPAGSATTNPKVTGSALLTQYQVTGGVADAVGLSLSWQVSGTVTDSFF
jgi:hypothetical protein